MRIRVTIITIIIIGATTVVGTTTIIFITIDIASVCMTGVLTCLIDLYCTSGVRTAYKGKQE